MRGDFTRFTFDPKKHYSGVLMQQGRVQLDADWNEQQAIIGHRLATEAEDLIGASGAPEGSAGFQIVSRHGLNFDGKDDYVRVDTPRGLSFPGNQPFTIEAWVNPDPDGTGGTILSKFSCSGATPLEEAEYYLEIGPDGTVAFHRAGVAGAAIDQAARKGSNGKFSVQTLRSTSVIPFGRYSHIAVVYDGAEGRIYTNSQLCGVAPLTLCARETITSFLMGARLNGLSREGLFSGTLVEVRIWSVERTQAEIARQMYEPLDGDEDGLAACWQFNEASGSMARDKGRQGNDGAFGEAVTDQPERVRPAWLTRGRYYVKGILCENEENVDLAQQPDYPEPVLPTGVLERSAYLAYLDVWERPITALEDASIREVALGGPDTSTRARLVWQVKLLPIDAEALARDPDTLHDAWQRFLWKSGHKAKLRARRLAVANLGNQLYRVEVHDSGGLYGWPRPVDPAVTPVPVEEVWSSRQQVRVKDWVADNQPWAVGQLVEVFSRQTDQQGQPGILARISELDQSQRTLILDRFPAELAGHEGIQLRRVATFKWSRDNGAVAFPIRRIQRESGVVTLDNLGHDQAALKEGDWVEVADDDSVLLSRPGPLGRVEFIDRTHNQVSLGGSLPDAEANVEKHPLLLRWDQTRVSIDAAGGAAWLNSDQAQVILLQYGALPAYSNVWIGLEDGVQVSFTGNGYYQTGDFWLIPARSLMENVEWPQGPDGPMAQPPQGVHHSYACLALLEVTSKSITVQDLRQIFRPVTTDYVPKTGGAISGSLAIEGSLNVGGSVTADSFIGPLGPGAVGTEQLVDHAVTEEKLDSTIGTVPSGFAILGDTATAPPGYAYTGSVIVSVNLQPSYQKVAEIPSQIGGHLLNGASGGTVASVAVKDHVYVFLDGGELLEYSPASGQWAMKSSLPSVRRGFAVAAWNDRIYVMGGSDEAGAKTALNEEYNPATNTWQARAAMSIPRSNLAAAVLGSRIYATGGIDASGKETCAHEAYQPETNAWERMADLPTARSDLAMGVANSKLYAIGGEKSKFLGLFGEAITGENEEYCPAENRWSSRRAHMPTPRRGLMVAAVNNSLYAIGGLGRDGLAALAERYDPSYDRWQDGMSLPSPLACQGIAALNGDIFVVGEGPAANGSHEVLKMSINSIFYIHRKI